jgi:hypothetical protein
MAIFFEGKGGILGEYVGGRDEVAYWRSTTAACQSRRKTMRSLGHVLEGFARIEVVSVANGLCEAYPKGSRVDELKSFNHHYRASDHVPLLEPVLEMAEDRTTLI